ncbi:MAG TPA: hypothetical protein VE268_09690 [Herpetosiphonaceae bacterium]|jgi:hypothetical protein|nr:hypothetical protein [Herpetosiphonaceae bacterium]
MQNKRSAILALAAAGAAYAWRNRDKLQQQFRQLGAPRQRPPRQLPDYSSHSEPQSLGGGESWQQPRERDFGGSEA